MNSLRAPEGAPCILYADKAAERPARGEHGVGGLLILRGLGMKCDRRKEHQNQGEDGRVAIGEKLGSLPNTRR
jgi:hypothetical protein